MMTTVLMSVAMMEVKLMLPSTRMSLRAGSLIQNWKK